MKLATSRWVIIPTEFHDLEELGCDMECSGYSHLYMHTSWPWFKHVLPQLADRRYGGKLMNE